MDLKHTYVFASIYLIILMSSISSELETVLLAREQAWPQRQVPTRPQAARTPEGNKSVPDQPYEENSKIGYRGMNIAVKEFM